MKKVELVAQLEAAKSVTSVVDIDRATLLEHVCRCFESVDDALKNPIYVWLF